MKYRRLHVFLAGVLLLLVLLTGCGQKKKTYPELYIDPEMFSTGFQSERRSVPVFFSSKWGQYGQSGVCNGTFRATEPVGIRYL